MLSLVPWFHAALLTGVVSGARSGLSETISTEFQLPALPLQRSGWASRAALVAFMTLSEYGAILPAMALIRGHEADRSVARCSVL